MSTVLAYMEKVEKTREIDQPPEWSMSQGTKKCECVLDWLVGRLDGRLICVMLGKAVRAVCVYESYVRHTSSCT